MPRNVVLPVVASKIAQTIVDPHDHSPLRLPSFPNLEKTSILNLMGTGTFGIPDSGSKYAVITRSPAAPLWVNDTATLTGSVSYTWSTGSSNPGIPSYAGASVNVPDLMKNEPVVIVNGTGFWSGIGLDAKGDYWFWTPADCTASLSFGLDSALSGGSYTCEVEIVRNFCTTNSGKINLTLAYAASPNRLVGTFVSTGLFWRPLLVSCTADATTHTAKITQYQGAWYTAGTILAPTALEVTGLRPFFSKPFEFTKSQYIYQGCRLNALSVLFQNCTAVLSKEGTVVGGVFVTTSDNDPYLTWNYNLDSYVSDLSANFRYNGLLEKGCYTFTLPDAYSQNFRDCSLNLAVPVFNLDGSDYVNIVKFSDLGSDTKGQNINVTVDLHLEFRNTTMLWPVSVGTTPLEEWHQAQIVLHQMPVFYENPTHLMAIANLARVAAARLLPYAGPVLRAGMNAVKAKAIDMASQMVASKLSNMKKKTNSRPKKAQVRAKVVRKR